MERAAFCGGIHATPSTSLSSFAILHFNDSMNTLSGGIEKPAHINNTPSPAPQRTRLVQALPGGAICPSVARAVRAQSWGSSFAPQTELRRDRQHGNA